MRRIQAWAELGAVPKLELFPHGPEGARALVAALDSSAPAASGWLLPDGDTLTLDLALRVPERLNMARDQLGGLLPGPLVIVLAPVSLQDWMARAPDLLEVRRGTWSLRARAEQQLREWAQTRVDNVSDLELAAARVEADEAEGRGQVSTWVQARVRLAHLLALHGDLRRATEQATQAEALARREGYLAGVTAALTMRAFAARLHGSHEEAASLLADALTTGAAPDTQEVLNARLNLADLMALRGRYDDAERQIDEVGREVARQGDTFGVAHTAEHKAQVFFSKGDRLGALRVLREEVIPEFEVRDNLDRLANAWAFVADIEGETGSLDEAARIFEKEVIPRYERLGSPRDLALSASKLGDIREMQGRLDEALQLHRDVALPLHTKSGDEREKAVTLGKIADALNAKGDWRESLRLRQEEEAPVYKRLGDVREQAVCELKIARNLGQLDRSEEGLKLLKERVLPAFAALGNEFEVANAHVEVAVLHLRAGAPREALATLDRHALPTLRRIGERSALARALFYRAQALASLGDVHDAVTLADEIIPTLRAIGENPTLHAVEEFRSHLMSRKSAPATPQVRSRLPNRAERRAARRKR